MTTTKCWGWRAPPLWTSWRKHTRSRHFFGTPIATVTQLRWIRVYGVWVWSNSKYVGVCVNARSSLPEMTERLCQIQSPDPHHTQSQLCSERTSERQLKNASNSWEKPMMFSRHVCVWSRMRVHPSAAQCVCWLHVSFTPDSTQHSLTHPNYYTCRTPTKNQNLIGTDTRVYHMTTHGASAYVCFACAIGTWYQTSVTDQSRTVRCWVDTCAQRALTGGRSRINKILEKDRERDRKRDRQRERDREGACARETAKAREKQFEMERERERERACAHEREHAHARARESEIESKIERERKREKERGREWGRERERAIQTHTEQKTEKRVRETERKKEREREREKGLHRAATAAACCCYTHTDTHIHIRTQTHTHGTSRERMGEREKLRERHKKRAQQADFMPHTCMSHVTHAWVMSHTCMSHVTHVNKPHHTYEGVTWQTWMSHVTRIDRPCHADEWVT